MAIDPQEALRAARRNEQQRPIDKAASDERNRQAEATSLQSLVDTFLGGIAAKGYAGSRVVVTKRTPYVSGIKKRLAPPGGQPVESQAGWLLRLRESNTLGTVPCLYLLADGTFFDSDDGSIKTVGDFGSVGPESEIQSLIIDPTWEPQY